MDNKKKKYRTIAQLDKAQKLINYDNEVYRIIRIIPDNYLEVINVRSQAPYPICQLTKEHIDYYDIELSFNF